MTKRLLYLSNLIFLLLFLVLAWHNRLATDDFYFLEHVHQYGIIGATKVEYSFGSSRWLSVLLIDTVLGLIPYFNALFFYNIISILAITLAFAYLLKSICLRLFSFNPTLFLLLNLALFGVNAFFYSTFDAGNTWLWLSASPTYLWSFIFFILGCAIVMSSSKFIVPKLFVLAICFLYIGGSAEAFASIILLGLVITIIWLSIFKPSLQDKKVYLFRLYVAFFFCLSSLIVLYLGPGNVIRRKWLGEISLLRAFVLDIETTGWIGLHWISRIVPYVLIFSVPLIYAGKYLSCKNSVLKENLLTIRKKLVKAVLLYGLLIYIINYPITYLLCGIGPPRALLSVSFLTWGLFAFACIYIGYKTTIKEVLVKRVTLVALSLCILLNTYNTINQYIITSKYAYSYDALITELLQNKNSGSVIKVSPLPPSGMLTPMVLSKDSMTDNNMFVKRALGLKAKIMLNN
jgi:hypothetical protein